MVILGKIITVSIKTREGKTAFKVLFLKSM